MIATIAPLVKVAPKQWLISALLYVFASVIAGAALGVGFGWIGQSLFNRLPTAVLVPCAVVFGLMDLGLIGRGVPTVSGSVPRDWWERLGATRAAALYGLVLGFGISTLVPLASFYFLLIGAALAGPTAGLLIGAAYGAARAFPVLAASSAIVAGTNPLAVGDWGYSRRVAARTIAGVVVLAFGVALSLRSLT